MGVGANKLKRHINSLARWVRHFLGIGFALTDFEEHIIATVRSSTTSSHDSTG